MNLSVKKRENGVSLVIVSLIMAMCLSVVFGISIILIDQNKAINAMGNSVRAIYLGDSGIEKTLYYDKSSSITGQIGNRGICYSVSNCYSLGLCSIRNIFTGSDCNNSCTGCTMGFSSALPGFDAITNPSNKFDMKVIISSTDPAVDTSFQSTGNFQGTTRLIELDIPK